MAKVIIELEDIESGGTAGMFRITYKSDRPGFNPEPEHNFGEMSPAERAASCCLTALVDILPQIAAGQEGEFSQLVRHMGDGAGGGGVGG